MAKTNETKTAATPKPPKPVRSCVCGCERTTKGAFAPGHDARVAGWMRRAIDGEATPEETAAVVALRASPGRWSRSTHFQRLLAELEGASLARPAGAADFGL